MVGDDGLEPAEWLVLQLSIPEWHVCLQLQSGTTLHPAGSLQQLQPLEKTDQPGACTNVNVFSNLSLQLMTRTEEILPFIYTPTVGEACQTYHELPMLTQVGVRAATC